jgi:pSer/pThr/pTyr-binding forkhead associated (FHA) protein
MDKCPTCGFDVRPGDNFCLSCGNHLFPSASSPQQSSILMSDATIPDQDKSGPGASPPVSVGWDDVSAKSTVASSPADSSTVRADTSEYISQPLHSKIDQPARFVIHAPNGDTLQDYLLEKPDIVIGRIPESDISFPEDRLISRMHATVHYEDGHYMLRDEGSANGTLVNNQPLARMTDWTLRNGDEVLIGDHVLTFKAFTPIPSDIEESATVIMPFGSPIEDAPQVDDDKTIIANEPLGTKTMDVANQPSLSPTPAPESIPETPAPGSEVAGQPVPVPVATPESPPSAPPAPGTGVTLGSFSRLSQPSLPGMDALLTASTALNEQIASLQQQLLATQEAMRNHNAEVAQTADQLRTALRRLAERMENTISSIARSRDEMDWDSLQRTLQDVLGSPRDIGYAMEFSRRAPDVDKVIQRYQGVLNTLAECNSLLRGLIGETIDFDR